MKLEKNSYEEWQKMYEKMSSEEIRMIEVEIKEGEDELVPIANLRYAFPLIAYLLENEKISKEKKLTINLILDEKYYGANIKRLSSYLNFAKNIPEVIFKINGVPINEVLSRNNQKVDIIDSWEANRILPIFSVVSDRNNSIYPYYQKLNECQYDVKTGRNIGNTTKNPFIEIANSMLDYFQIEKHYVGTVGSPLKKEDKIKLINQLNDIFKQSLENMSILSQIIWLYILREFLSMKILFNISKKEGEVHLYENIIRKSRLDAVVYGECIFQLIENSCIHSHGHQAWFGFHVYYVDKDVSMSKLEHNTRYRNRLYNEYKDCFENKNNVSSRNIFNDNYKYFFDWFVLDNASNKTGMIMHYKKEHKKNCNFEDIAGLFHIPINNYDYEQHIKDITIHYGLRLLKKIVFVNNGYLIGKTPHGDQTKYYYNENPSINTKKLNVENTSYITEWKCIIPIDCEWNNSEKTKEIHGEDCFGSKVLPPRSKLFFMNEHKIFLGIEKQNKIQDINKISSNISKYISENDDKNLEDSVVVLKVESKELYNYEVLSKALFAEIAKINGPQSERFIALRIAVIFSDFDAIFEFVRFFSVFYPGGIQSDMKNVQIALCIQNSDEVISYDVAVMLVGTDIRNTYKYAKLFAYNHSDNILKYLPILEYLTKDNNNGNDDIDDKEDISLFPFELCLPINIQDTSIQSLDLKLNWFINRMKKILHTEIQSKNYGCMIDDIHIRIGSKLHMNRFFQAELLFQNMGNVIRFSYMITQELLYGKNRLEKEKSVLLLGYEKYSSTLILQIEHFLKKSGFFYDVNSAIVHDEDREEVALRPFFETEKDIFCPDKSVQIITILPVSTTLSTVYKMKNVIKRKYNLSIDSNRDKNFCLILVNNSLNKYTDFNDITKRFWLQVERGNQVVTLQQERSKGNEEQVMYFINADAEWFDPQTCPLCIEKGKNIRPIIGGKHSDTMPEVIFQLLGPRAGTFEKLVGSVENNKKRIKYLFGNVYYAHIYDGDNHYQFYIDFKRLYEKNKEKIINDIKNNAVVDEAFHVVVSPLQITNSEFVKAVIDYAFNGNVRFLHINLNDAYREEVRAKFSFLTNEYNQIKLTNPEKQIQFHFVDSSIVTGTRLNRARLLLRMLLNQSNIAYNDAQLFNRVFLLVNRCSYDTANYFVNEPNENLYAFIHLSIPSYNTENDYCPACKLVNKFQLLSKRSTTERLSFEFQRLKEKHKKRTFDEYQEWLMGNDFNEILCDTVSSLKQTGEVFNDSAYFGWLTQWLYVNVPDSHFEVLSFIPEVGDLKTCKYEDIKFVKERVLLYVTKISGYYTDKVKVKDKLSKISLNDIVDSIDSTKDKILFIKTVREIMKTYLIGVRDYMRLSAMEEAYESLDKIKLEKSIMKFGTLRDAILKMIYDTLNQIEKQYKNQLINLTSEEKIRFLLTCKIEWIISYIKVISRAQLANYYEYRQAITSIMSDMLSLLSDEVTYKNHMGELLSSNSNSDISIEYWRTIGGLFAEIRYFKGKRKEEKKLRAKLCYQINMMLIHRMADLQINSRINSDSIISIIKLYEELEVSYQTSDEETEDNILIMPTLSKTIIRYLKAVKTATMTSNNDIPCIEMAKTSKDLETKIKKFKDEKIKDNLSILARYIYLENTRMFYTGMSDIRNMIFPRILQNIKEKPMESCLISDINILSNEIRNCFNECYSNSEKKLNVEKLLYQNSLANFCYFWHISTDEAPINGKDEVEKLAYMLRYFIILNDLLDEENAFRNIDELPYLYEELCHMLCKITKSDMCYLVYCHSGNYPEIFAQSGYHIDLLKSGKILNCMQMDQVIRKSEEKRKEYIPGIVTCFDEYLVLAIHLMGEKNDSDIFYIVLQFGTNNELTNEKYVLQKARDVLFLRRHLQKSFTRDYTILINFRFDYSYVKRLSSNSYEYPIVMHISDLHIQKNMIEEKNNIGICIEKILKKDSCNIDLLVISGDIIDGKDANAARMEQNYQYAEQILNEIVIKLWENGTKYLPHDWKKRIIITTGNHDYASMNQYQATQKRRALVSAMPAEGESGTMAKFAYFIEFLIRYLDVPIDQLLSNDLNEIRFYRNLNTKVLVLNCSGKATPLRTNKIGINERIVQDLLNRDVWNDISENIYMNNNELVVSEQFRLVVGHYSPYYKLSYFLDNYDILPGWVFELTEYDNAAVNEVVESFQKAVKEEISERTKFGQSKESVFESRNEFKAIFSTYRDAVNCLEKGGILSSDIRFEKFNDIFKKEINKICGEKGYKDEDIGREKLIKRIKGNALYQYLEKYYNVLNNQDFEWTEDLIQFIYEVYESIDISQNDKLRFQKFVNDKIKDKDLYLAGHIHSYSECLEKRVLVADKMISDKGNVLHGYIIKYLGKKNGENKYEISRFENDSK